MDDEYDDIDWTAYEKLQKEEEMYEADLAEIRARDREGGAGPLEEYLDSLSSEIKKKDKKEKKAEKIIYKACAG